ncbi:MAG: nucleotidyltransferase [Bacilli bacterium]
MTTIGIIAEYNPFHNGHLYHINKIKELYPDSLIILVLNGYFLERGEISLLTKEDKTKIALKNNVDIVIELPFLFGSQAADIFALNAIKILNALHVDKLIFGSESNNIELLDKIASIQLYDPDYEILMKKNLESGYNYPTALAKSLNIKEDFNKPNDLLGISYIKALKITNSNIIPETIKRTSSYHDKNSTESIVSASNIREKLKNKENIRNYLPTLSLKSIKRPKSYFELLKYKILTSKDLSIYLTVDEGIENRLKKAILISNSIEELIENTKTKRYTYNKINRMLIHILIGLTKEDNEVSELDYIKVLGFNKQGRKYLNSIKKEMSIPITINRESLVYKYELIASSIYDLLCNTNCYQFEIKQKPVKY